MTLCVAVPFTDNIKGTSMKERTNEVHCIKSKTFCSTDDCMRGRVQTERECWQRG